MDKARKPGSTAILLAVLFLISGFILLLIDVLSAGEKSVIGRLLFAGGLCLLGWGMHKQAKNWEGEPSELFAGLPRPPVFVQVVLGTALLAGGVLWLAGVLSRWAGGE